MADYLFSLGLSLLEIAMPKISLNYLVYNLSSLIQYYMKHSRFCIYILPLLLSLILPASSLWIPVEAFGASSLDIMDRQRMLNLSEPLSKPKIIVKEDGTLQGAQEGTQFLLKSLSISGCTVFAEPQLLAPYKDLIGKPTNFSQLSVIAAALTRKYREAGYLLSRVIIPEQEVDQNGANIRLQVIEGYIESIEYNGGDRIRERFKSYFSPIEKNLVGYKPLRHIVFERYMLLTSDVPGIKVSSRFKKGNVPGGSILVIDVDDQIVEAEISYGNTGTESAGPFIGTASLAVNTLPVIGAQTSVSYSQANNYKEYWTITAAQRYQMWNGLNFTFTYSHSDSPEMDTEFARQFDYRSKSDTFNFGISYPIIRSRDLNLFAGLNYEHRNSDAYVLDERFTKDHMRAVSGNINFDFADSLGGVTQLITTLTRGLNIWDATDYSILASNSLAPAEYWKIDLYGSRNQQLPFNFSFFTAAEAQFSNESLSSYNKFFLGGSRFGRGYDPGVVEGDNGFAASAEPRWTYALTDNTSLQLFGFIDWGTVWTNESVWGTPDQQSLSSAGGGIRLWGHEGNEYVPGFNISAYVGQPLQQIKGDSDFYNTRFVFQAGMNF